MKQLSGYLGIRPCTLTYLLLIAISLTTFLIGKLGFSGLGMSLLVLFLALIKGQLVGSYFMGLGSVRGIWRWPVFIWLFIPGILIGMAFYLSYQ
ncbi:MAG: cytochrome C oxidase subunit IV family protein [Candidatus Thiodiazotropha weberae]|uniref:O-succinylhomoserine sulfhydrylase n=1 Tax=Candidatus Thiodiazotropha endoloripes TaxID=1818881 RepID=A0A1E2UPM0_9GAMM|nr:cytochrome C oxidase subunit IV family protein [Candidatus Thiodiazotropha endoloripes]MCG7899065.1 cytochrome C oxidase subunit IV family protein [Candidatus Thiodiazotropha weberae]MCG7913252.1 cytochrome C oxidase subunit IV family protein [Candidatus Thiodiazotropha weberae]ODB87384.1 O-succinylhomoserine sulfhydrylase [Candidatus Thiodiazotropha endoloripes]ODB90266.1 O-succinylhomoserine sulfhydrylase [Candidatus Thiodiazotropha endoloripes]ODB92022.1 O-succinylhomoserine sulfhydrylas